MTYKNKAEAQQAIDEATREAGRLQELRDSERVSLTSWHDYSRQMHEALAEARRIRALLPTLPE